MNHDADAIERERVTRHVGFEETKPGMAAEVLEIPFLQRAGVERVEVVGAHDLVPPRKQRLTQVGADEARRPRDQEASAHAATSPRK